MNMNMNTLTMSTVSMLENVLHHLQFTNETHTASYANNDLAEFTAIDTKFHRYHLDPTNILLHGITTPLGIFGFLGLVKYITRSTTATSVLCLTYVLNLVASVPLGVFLGTLVTLAVCLFGAYKLRLGLFPSLVLIALAYVLQDLAHMMTGEQTLQSTYSAGGHIDLYNLSTWSKMFTEHAFFLLPLCVSSFLKLVAPKGFPPLFSGPLPSSIQPLEDWVWVLLPVAFFSVGNYCIDSKNGWSIFPGNPCFKRIFHVNFATDPKEDPESRKADLAMIRAWALKMMPSHNQSSHWWVRDLSPEVRDAFNRCANSSHIARAFRQSFSEKHYCLEVIDGMNEVYVTGPPRFDEQFNSDQIFYTKHVDGPFGLAPFVSVYRSIVGMDKNLMITTRFPMSPECSLNACEGDVLIFDYNREVHYITSDESQRSLSDEYRVVLKLHYSVYPRILAPLGWLMGWANTQYNILFRALFLKTINPTSMYEKFLAWNVVFHTNLMNDIELYIGQRNIVYLAFAALLWWCTGSYDWFLLSTSFVHYIRYIQTYYYRGDIDYGSFKRDVFLFKCLSIGQVIGHYLFPHEPLKFTFDPISVAMILIGYGISFKATLALGVDRTYFGAELGKCEPKWINEFPYGYIPHPMIVSQIFALLGFLKADHFRHSCPYLIHCHIAFYMTHMLQEHWDLWHQTVKQYFGTSTKKVKMI